MAELFQLDEAEALDFGLYRIIRRHNREMREFLGEIVTGGDRKILQGGRLSALAAMDRTEVLNRLYQFFSRHYQDGDFIVERRYGRDGSRYIRSTGSAIRDRPRFLLCKLPLHE